MNEICIVEVPLLRKCARMLTGAQPTEQGDQSAVQTVLKRVHMLLIQIMRISALARMKPNKLDRGIHMAAVLLESQRPREGEGMGGSAWRAKLAQNKE